MAHESGGKNTFSNYVYNKSLGALGLRSLPPLGAQAVWLMQWISDSFFQNVSAFHSVIGGG